MKKYYSILLFTIVNFTLLQNTLLHEMYFSTKLEFSKIPLSIRKVTIFFYLGIEFYLFVSHGGMNDRVSTCKFRNVRSAFRNLHVDPLPFIPP